MTRLLFVVPPLTGHITPLVAVARTLAAAGHQVTWCGDPAMIGPLAGPDAVVRQCPPRPFRVTQPREDLRGYAAVKFLWEDFLVPYAHASAETVIEAATRDRPDVIVADMQALAGPLAAARLGLPWATSATTSAPLSESFTATPKVREWLDGLFTGLIDRYAADAPRRLTPRDVELSPDLVIAFTTEALVGATDPSLSQIRYVGLARVPQPGAAPDFPWSALDGRPLVVATMGTVNADVSGRFLAACRQAATLLGGRAQMVIADPAGVLGADPAGVAGDPPTDVIVRPHLPLLELIGRASAVICHGGHNTVCESLAHGVPLVLAPIRDDQPVIAGQVVDTGAGVRLRFGRATPEMIRDAVVRVLDEPGHRAAAAAVRASFDAAGSADAAARHLLELAGTPARRLLVP